MPFLNFCAIEINRAQRAIPLPATRPEYLMVRIRSIAAGAEAWKKRVDVFLRTTGELKVVGIEREE